MTKMLSGACLCRAVRYEVEDAFGYAMNCHCSNCRRTTGAAYKPMGGIAIGKFRIAEGEEKILTFGKGAAKDLHCGVCGSLIYSIVREGAYAHVPLGTLDDDPTIRPQAHIFVGSKAPWHEITDGLPQFREFPE